MSGRERPTVRRNHEPCATHGLRKAGGLVAHVIGNLQQPLAQEVSKQVLLVIMKQDRRQWLCGPWHGEGGETDRTSRDPTLFRRRCMRLRLAIGATRLHGSEQNRAFRDVCVFGDGDLEYKTHAAQRCRNPTAGCAVNNIKTIVHDRELIPVQLAILACSAASGLLMASFPSSLTHHFGVSGVPVRARTPMHDRTREPNRVNAESGSLRSPPFLDW